MLRKLRTGIREGCRYICDSGRSGECTDEGTGSGLSGSECGSGKGCDNRFKQFVQSVFDKKLVSSVFLTGEGFENNWYPLSLKCCVMEEEQFWETIFIAREHVIPLQKKSGLQRGTDLFGRYEDDRTDLPEDAYQWAR